MNETNQVDIEKILELLPHRYPFLLVDRVLDYSL
ncbi:MAG: 3-hydroxyacyl-[acyl-carrier-protein] dehydratase FabZ, partial [Gammaproteobacteria bacterium]|nr:3-hydroxyacyl-[acyl-carrier-protein] dehydratase FabZ [Gammaproteobacteria bacterium]